jgi:hypothetical protein
MKKLHFYLLLCILLLCFNCKKEKIGGACEYILVDKEMIATFVDGDLNGVFTISFQQKSSTTDEVYRIDSKEMKNILRNFDLKEFQNKSNVYKMTFEEISKGTCVPFVIKKIKLN